MHRQAAGPIDANSVTPGMAIGVDPAKRDRTRRARGLACADAPIARPSPTLADSGFAYRAGLAGADHRSVAQVGGVVRHSVRRARHDRFAR